MPESIHTCQLASPHNGPGQLMNSQHHSAESIKQLATPLGSAPRRRPLCTDHQMTQMGRNQTKARLPLYKEGPPFKSHSCNKLGKSGPATLGGLLFYQRGPCVTVSEIKFMALRLQKAVKIETQKLFSTGFKPGTAS